MSADVIRDACVRIPVIGVGVAAREISSTAAFSTPITTALLATLSHAQKAQDRLNEL
jgi:chromate reductase, NAD(P)H dehydrogenase (quinone)